MASHIIQLPDPPHQPSSPTFEQMPDEIMEMILVFSFTPRYVDLYTHMNDEQQDKVELFSSDSFRSPAKLPAGLHLNAQTRRITLGYYELAFPFNGQAPEVYFNFNIDCLWLRNNLKVQMFGAWSHLWFAQYHRIRHLAISEGEVRGLEPDGNYLDFSFSGLEGGIFYFHNIESVEILVDKAWPLGKGLYDDCLRVMEQTDKPLLRHLDELRNEWVPERPLFDNFGHRPRISGQVAQLEFHFRRPLGDSRPEFKNIKVKSSGSTLNAREVRQQESLCFFIMHARRVHLHIANEQNVCRRGRMEWTHGVCCRVEDPEKLLYKLRYIDSLIIHALPGFFSARRYRGRKLLAKSNIAYREYVPCLCNLHLYALAPGQRLSAENSLSPLVRELGYRCNNWLKYGKWRQCDYRNFCSEHRRKVVW